MIFEVCADSVAGAIAAEKYGAKRIELCSALSVGGLTPSVGLVEECAVNSTVEVHAMLRHREGNFQYTKDDVAIMQKDIIALTKAGAKGVVFGILDEKKEFSELNLPLIEKALENGLEVTFHRAFDFTSSPEKTIEKLIENKVTRLLTSGGKPTAFEGLELITKLQKDYGSDIQIMAGSGVNASNALQIAESGVGNLHFTAKKSVGQVLLSMGEQTIVDEDKIKSITALF